MAFSWSPVTKGVTLAKKQHVNEIRNAADSLATDLTVALYSWVHIPVDRGDPIKHVQLQELKDALDYVSDNNICNADNISVNATDDLTDHDTDNSTDDYNEDGTYHGTDNATNDYNEDATWHGTDNIPRHDSDYSFLQTTAYQSNVTGDT